MSQCLACGSWWADEPEYGADSVCPACRRAGWQEGSGGTVFRDPLEPSAQPDGHAEPMKSICCVCQAHLRGPVDATVISHGLCPSCYQKQIADAEASCPL